MTEWSKKVALMPSAKKAPPKSKPQTPDGTQWADVAPCVGDTGDAWAGYYVARTGKVYSAKIKDGTLMPLSLRTDRYGYKYVRFKKGGVVSEHNVHRLVARAYIPNPQGLGVVNHKDKNPANNHVDNLEWMTQAENVHYSLLSRDQIIERLTRIGPYGQFLEIDWSKKTLYTAYRARKFYVRFLNPTNRYHVDGYKTMCQIPLFNLIVWSQVYNSQKK